MYWREVFDCHMVEIASWVARFCRIHAKNDQNNFNFVVVVYRKLLGTLSIDNEMHDDDVRNPRRIGSRVSFLVLRRRRALVLGLVALAMAFKNVRNLLLINHNDGFIDDDEFVVLYDLFASKNLDFPYDSYAFFDLEELDGVSFWKTRYTNSEGSFANPWHNYL